MKTIMISFATLFFSISGLCQSKQKLSGNWVIENFQFTGKSKDVEKIQNEVKGIIFAFNENTVSISNTNKECSNVFFKSGYYSLKDNIITFGKDKAEFTFISENKFQIIIPTQGIITCAKNTEL